MLDVLQEKCTDLPPNLPRELNMENRQHIHRILLKKLLQIEIEMKKLNCYVTGLFRQ